MLLEASSAPLCKKERKKMKQQIEKIPVLTIGTIRPATIRAIKRFFLIIKLNKSPATTPAKVHFNKHVMNVPIGEIDIKKAVDGDTSAIMPLKKPTIPPDKGPHNAAAITTARSETLMFI